MLKLLYKIFWDPFSEPNSEQNDVFAKSRKEDADFWASLVIRQQTGVKDITILEMYQFQFYIDDNPLLDIMFRRIYSGGFSQKGQYFIYNGSQEYSDKPFRDRPIWNENNRFFYTYKPESRYYRLTFPNL